METYNVGNAHLSFQTDRPARRRSSASAGRAELRSDDPVLIEWGPYEGGYAARIRDPDGITIELVQLPAGGVKL